MNPTENSDRYNVFLIGNNPQEISTMESNLSKYHKMDFIADVGFDLRDSLSMVFKQKPNYILLDDCYPVLQVRRLIQRIRNNRETEEIPIALLKSSNRYVRIDGIQDFFLKDNFSAERLFYAIRNSRKIRRTQIVLYKSYKKSRRHYQSLKDYLKKYI
jgi:CheY-like chemotaxis protein